MKLPKPTKKAPKKTLAPKGMPKPPEKASKPRREDSRSEKAEHDHDACTVYISNLNYQFDRQMLKVLFSNFGNVRHVKLVMDPETKKSKGMAFIELGSPAEVTKAIKALNGQILEGRTVKVSHAIPMKNAPIKRLRSENKEDKEEKKKPKTGKTNLKTYLARKAKQNTFNKND